MSCPNDEFCGVKSKLSDEYWLHFTHCMTCRSFGWGTLHIHDAQDECSICGEEVSRKLKFPNKDCSHSFCLSCSRNIIFWDETRYHLNPCKYGCPPCPKIHGKTKTLRTSINIMMMKIFQFKKEKKQDLLLVVENVPYVVEAYNFFFFSNREIL